MAKEYPDSLYLQFSFWRQVLLILWDTWLTQIQETRAWLTVSQSLTQEIQRISRVGRQWNLLESLLLSLN